MPMKQHVPWKHGHDGREATNLKQPKLFHEIHN